MSDSGYAAASPIDHDDQMATEDEWWTGNQPPEFTQRSPRHPEVNFHSMEELAKLPAPRWLLPNLIPDSGLGILIANPEAGKSFFLLDLAQSICRGLPVLGDHELMPERIGWVLALLPEAAASWATRTRTYLDYHNVDSNDDFVCCLQQNNLADAITWAAVYQAILSEIDRRGTPPVLVIVDTLSASISGVDENHQAAMTPLMSNLQSLSAMGACVIVAHHTAKSGGQYRGSSVIKGACDWMISIERTGCLREFRSVKLRDAETIASKAFKIVPHGEGAVCIGTEAQGPWGIYDEVTRDHPGLGEALCHHGFETPGSRRRTNADSDICTDGVDLSNVQTTWNRLDPITPTSREDLQKYKSIHNSRQTTLLNLISALLRGGVLEVQEGEFSLKRRNMKVIVKQVTTHDD